MSAIIQVQVEKLHEAHPQIRAEDWRSPLVSRLTGNTNYIDGQKDVADSFRAPHSSRPQESQIRLTWEGLQEDFKKCAKTYQIPVLTEFATLGLSCILLEKRARLEITEVTLRGEKADYWLGDKELLLEVSGQQSGDLARLHSEKAAQLKANPFQKDGYVCVANYGETQAQLWHHSYE